MHKAVNGELFEDLDKRHGNRVVKVLDADSRAFRVKVEVTVSELRPNAVGRKYWLNRTTLGDLTRYKRISH